MTVAAPAALVAMKLHSIQDRKQERPAKAASDAEDLYRLIREHNGNGQLVTAVTQAPYGLPHLVAEAAERMLVDDALARRRSLLSDGGASAEAIDPEDFELVTTEFVQGLSRRADLPTEPRQCTPTLGRQGLQPSERWTGDPRPRR